MRRRMAATAPVPASTEDTAWAQAVGAGLCPETDSARLFPKETWTHPQRVGARFESQDTCPGTPKVSASPWEGSPLHSGNAPGVTPH